MPSLTLVRGDQNYFIEFEVRDADGVIVDITGCSIGFHMQRYGDSTLTLNKAGTISTGSGTLGLVRVFIATELVNKSGEHYSELEIRWPSGKILTAPDIYVKILKDLPR